MTNEPSPSHFGPFLLDRILHTPQWSRYEQSFQTGETLFLEGDASQDLYILASGSVDILKGTKKLAQFSGEGRMFGEMSFLLGENRTATVKAASQVRVFCIPRDQIGDFIQAFPETLREFAVNLARRLNETSQVLFGMKVFGDQIPEAVLLTDEEGKVTFWNAAATDLYGRTEGEMTGRPMEDIYEDPQEFRALMEEIRATSRVPEKTLKVIHPEKGRRYISTTTTVLYDGQHLFRGILSLGRDVTSVEALQVRYRRTRRWLLPSLMLSALLMAGWIWGYPYFSKGYHVLDEQKQAFRDNLSVDYRMLGAMILEPLMNRDRTATTRALSFFFASQEGTAIPYRGVVLLDRERRVFDALGVKGSLDREDMIGSSYARIGLEAEDSDPYTVLVVYRAGRDHPMDEKGIEAAFVLHKDKELMGWVIFQMDMDVLKRRHGLSEEDLRTFRFEHP